VILRGGKQPNYHASDVAAAAESLSAFNLPQQLVIDFSHGNCLKQHRRQMDVAAEVAEQIKSGSRAVAGVMIESFLEEGNQKVVSGEPLVYGKSITDPCLGWQESEAMLALLAGAVSHRL
jgi:3-deoxy-7-phosphoheptulonate synthase